MENIQGSVAVNGLNPRSAFKTMKMGLLGTLLLLSASLHAEQAFFSDNKRPNPSANQHGQAHRLDQLTDKTLSAISSGNWEHALISASKLVNEYPDYSLGQWLLAETHNVVSMSEPLLETIPNYSSALVELLLEAQARAKHSEIANAIESTHEQSIPAEMLQIGQHIDTVVLVDLQASVLYQFDASGNTPILEKQHYVSSGEGGFGKQVEGDLKSPLGVYQVYGFRSDQSLPALYGSGALMLNYPNPLDRSLGRSGSGIWLHGNPPNDRSRSPRSSEGCVTMANEHLIDLYKDIDINRTHVILSHAVQWKSPSEIALQKERFRELFAQYRAAWVNNHVNDLFSLYTNDALPEQVRHASIGTTKKVSTAVLQQNRMSPVGIDLESLANVQLDDISLLMNPSLNNEKARHLIMSFELPGEKGARITLYWEQLSSDGYWRIKREAIEASDV